MAVSSDDPTLKATRDAYNNYTKASITYTFGEQTVTLDGSTLKEWLQFDDKGQLVQDDASFTQHIKDFVAQLALHIHPAYFPDQWRSGFRKWRYPALYRLPSPSACCPQSQEQW